MHKTSHNKFRQNILLILRQWNRTNPTRLSVCSVPREKKNLVQKKTDSIFDIAMVFFYGAEICDFVGLILLDKISNTLGLNNISLYRDDNLEIIEKTSGIHREGFKIKSSMYLAALISK